MDNCKTQDLPFFLEIVTYSLGADSGHPPGVQSVIIKDILFASTLPKARKAYQLLLSQALSIKSRYYQQILKMIGSRWSLLTVHHTIRIGRRKIPRSTNAIENVISYLNTRLKTMRKLRTASSAVPICNLIVINFRSKPLINTKNKLKRGKSPLALASRINRKFDWMTFIKNQPLK